MEEEICELSAGLRRGTLTAEALLDRCLERIRRLDPQLNSFVALDEAGARAAAKASDARLAGGNARSALEGIPLSVKDNIHAAGLPTTWGSRALAGVLPPGDELPVARLRAAGAVVVGKTNVPELTLEGYTKNDLFGVTRNPWDTRLTPADPLAAPLPVWRPDWSRRRSALTAAALCAGPLVTPVLSAGNHRPAAFRASTAFPPS